jgi:formate hydrogenlyase transcriptional activator
VADADHELRSALEDRLRFERLVCDLAAEFVNVEPDGVDGAIREAQRRVVEALDLDRSTLFQRSDEDERMFFTHFWSRPEFPPPPQALLVEESFPWALGKIQRGELVCFETLNDLPADAADREGMRRVGTKSNVTVPLKVAGTVIGALSFGSLRKERAWPADIVNRLVLLGQVFASALARKRADADLRRALDENTRLKDQLLEENVYLQNEVKVLHGRSGVMGSSAAMQQVLAQIDQVAVTNTTVLLMGETGTGKELLATAIHERSPRRSRPMVRVNCGGIPAALFESELFGREKGAYTGALTRQTGRFELAHDSTIFLDEIGDVPTDVQVKLLRVLENRQIERLGNPRPIDIDVRIIAATNRDLEQSIEDGRFREDLYYRLNVFPIRVPPLRERSEDIPALVRTYVDEFSTAFGKQIDTIPKDDVAALQRYHWPGNVRELRNVIERAVILAKAGRLRVELPRVRTAGPRSSVQMSDVEREHLRSVLESSGWRVRGPGGAAERLGLKASTLEGRMAKLALRRPHRQ